MTRQIVTTVPTQKVSDVLAYRTHNLVQYYRAVALFSISVRAAEFGLRRRR